MKSPRLAAALLFITLSSVAHAQDDDRGALYLRTGNDTVVADRFMRSRDTLQGIVVVKGQARFEYIAVLGPNETVRSLDVKVYAAGGSATDAPLQTIHIDMHGDSAAVVTAGGAKSYGTKAGAIPMFNNALALFELFSRRAKAAGGTADIAYFAMSSGATIAMSVKSVGVDSATLTVAGQTQRVRIDNRGRIMGGTIAGTPFEYLRGSPAAADGLKMTNTADTKPDYSAPVGAPYIAEEVLIPGPHGIKLGGTLTLPKNATTPLPAVVMITGSGQEDRDEYIPFAGGIRLFRQIADTLSRRGIAVLRLDDRGKGTSTGDYAASTTADFADDIRAALAWLRTRTDIDGNRLALAGHSEGGMIAPMVAATDPKLKGIVLLAGPADKGIDISLAQNKTAIDHVPGLSQAKRDSMYAVAKDTLAKIARGPVTWISYWLNTDPLVTARKVKTPVLIVQGETDTQVSPDQAGKLEDAFHEAGNSSVTRKMLPNRNHLFLEDADGNFNNYDKLKSNKIPADVLGTVADWLAKTLGARTVK